MKETYQKLKKYTKNQTTIWKIPDYGNKIWFIKKALDGKKYTNQTNGCGCNHPTAEGILYEVHDFGENNIPDIFNPKWWYGLYCRGGGYYTENTRNNGCGCNHPTAEGILYEVHDFGENNIPDIFNPKWWYGLYCRGGGYYTENTRKLAEKELGEIVFDIENYSYEKNEAKEQEYISYVKKNNLFISGNDIKEMFISELKKLVSDDFFDVDVIVPFLQKDKHEFEIKSSHEAWVYVRMYYKYYDEMYASMGLDGNQITYAEGIITWQNSD